MSMSDTDWRTKPKTSRRYKKPVYMTYYELMEWDGADGTSNKSSGFIVGSKELANKWCAQVGGRSYREFHGLYVSRLEDIPEAQKILGREKALAKLTQEEKQLLGLA